MREIRVFSALVLQAGMEIELDDNAHRHVARVLRLAVGDALTLFNGDGFDYVGEIGFCAAQPVSASSAGRRRAMSRRCISRCLLPCSKARPWIA